jgi:hypothetical protein
VLEIFSVYDDNYETIAEPWCKPTFTVSNEITENTSNIKTVY